MVKNAALFPLLRATGVSFGCGQAGAGESLLATMLPDT